MYCTVSRVEWFKDVKVANEIALASIDIKKKKRKKKR
jgi:hypothetical protein